MKSHKLILLWTDYIDFLVGHRSGNKKLKGITKSIMYNT